MHSTELREPFLDHRLVEFCFALPEEYKVKNNQGKWLARRAAASLLPQKVALAPKRPLQTPQREWMQKELSQWIDKRIEKLEDSPLGRWFDINAVQETYNLYKKKGDDNSFYVWQWVNLSSLNTHNPKAF